MEKLQTFEMILLSLSRNTIIVLNGAKLLWRSSVVTSDGIIAVFIYREIKELKTISEQAKVQTEDEIDLFCKSLAVQLKKMPLNRALICQEKLQFVMTQERLTQMPQSFPEVIYSDYSTPSPFPINQSPLYQNTTPEYNYLFN
ncbi:unnamed protein product [Colias eurytheme]|nr:unnamed protein product [Colias eurytheme]